MSIAENVAIARCELCLTLFVALPTPSKTAFNFCLRDRSLHLRFIGIPYAVQSGIICLPSLPFNWHSHGNQEIQNIRSTLLHFCKDIIPVKLHQRFVMFTRDMEN